MVSSKDNGERAAPQSLVVADSRAVVPRATINIWSETVETIAFYLSLGSLKHLLYDIMAGCVACSKPLTLYIEYDEEDAGSSSANTGSYVDDDVQLQCGCHFHWSVHLGLFNWR